MATANNDSTHNIDSRVYRWNGSAFAEIQSIATSGAANWEHLAIGADHYLAVANYKSGSMYNIDSELFRLTLE